MENFNYYNIKKNTQIKIDELKHQRPIFRYNIKTKKDEPIKYLSNRLHNWHIIFNPMKLNINQYELKDTFNFIKNMYGKFMYGKEWIDKLNLDFDLAIEKETYNHIHLLLHQMTTNEVSILFNYMADCFDIAFQTNTASNRFDEHPKYYCKQLENKNEFLNTSRFNKHPIFENSTNQIITRLVSSEQVPEFNILTYISKNEDTLFFTAKDFIKKEFE